MLFGAGCSLSLQRPQNNMCHAPVVHTLAKPHEIVPEKEPLGKFQRFGKWIMNWFLDLCRTVHLAIIFSPCVITFPFWLIIPVGEKNRDWWLALCVYCIQHAGPTFVKLGQWASTRADLFSLRIRKHLRVLQDQCIHESKHNTEKVITNAFHCKSVYDVFEEFDMTPIGSGCIAEVHQATTKEHVPAAVKVQRRRVAAMVHRDLSIMRRLVSVVDAILPADISEIMELEAASTLFAEFMMSQMDFHSESRNLTQFRENFSSYHVPVKFPEPFFVTECGRVLVESLEEGMSLSSLLYDHHGALQDEALRKKLGKTIVQLFLKMVLHDNFVHSDMHPGNMMVNLNAAGDDLAGLTILDVGLVTTLSEKDRRNFIDLFAAVAIGNGRLAGELMIERADPSKLIRCKNPEPFIDGIDKVVSRVNRDSFRLDKVQIGNVLEEVLTLVRVHQVPADPSFTNLVLSIIVLEGIGRQLDPSLDIFKESLPMLMKLENSMKIVAMKAVLTNLNRKYSKV